MAESNLQGKVERDVISKGNILHKCRLCFEVEADGNYPSNAFEGPRDHTFVIKCATGTVKVRLQESPDGGTTWNNLNSSLYSMTADEVRNERFPSLATTRVRAVLSDIAASAKVDVWWRGTP